MRTKVLIDSSFLYTLFDEDAKQHINARLLIEKNILILYIPDVVLVEVVYLAKRAGGIPAALKLLDGIANLTTEFEVLTIDDLRRAREIMAKYASAKLDFVDCAIMALAERLDITQILTFDRRDFGLVRPNHADYFTLLP